MYIAGRSYCRTVGCSYSVGLTISLGASDCERNWRSRTSIHQEIAMSFWASPTCESTWSAISFMWSPWVWLSTSTSMSFRSRGRSTILTAEMEEINVRRRRSDSAALDGPPAELACSASIRVWMQCQARAFSSEALRPRTRLVKAS